jgi:hypothetical protein
VTIHAVFSCWPTVFDRFRTAFPSSTNDYLQKEVFLL